MLKLSSYFLAVVLAAFISISLPIAAAENWRETALGELAISPSQSVNRNVTTPATIKPPPPTPLTAPHDSEWQVTLGLRPFQPQGVFELGGLATLPLETFGSSSLYGLDFDYCMGKFSDISWGLSVGGAMSLIKGQMTLDSGYEIPDVSLSTTVAQAGLFLNKPMNKNIDLALASRLGQLNYVLISKSGFGQYAKQIQFVEVGVNIGYKFLPNWSLTGGTYLSKSLTETDGLQQFSVSLGVKKWL